jgi:hypothetical protein
LVKVTWSDSVGKSTVTLCKGTETATVEFNEAEVHGVPAPVSATTVAVRTQAPVGSMQALVGSTPPPAVAKAVEERRAPFPPGSVGARRRDMATQSPH